MVMCKYNHCNILSAPNPKIKYSSPKYLETENIKRKVKNMTSMDTYHFFLT